IAQTYQEEVKESGLESLGDVTFEQIMDEYDQKNKAAQEVPESPYDTESEIKIIKRFQPSQPDDDAQITFLGAEPYDMEIDQTLKKADSDETDSGLQSMPDDDLASLSGFEAEDSDDEGSLSNHQDNLSNEGTAETFNASTDMPAQSDLFDHLLGELRTLSTKVDQLESSISKKVTDDIQSFMPSIVVDALKDSIAEKLPVFDAQVCYPSAGTEQREKWEKNNPEIPTEDNDAQNPDQTQGEQRSRDVTMANAQGEQPPTQELSNVEQAPLSMKKMLWFFMLQWKRTTSSIFLPTPLKELTPSRDQTPPIDESKGKGIVTKEPLKEIMPYMEESGSATKMPNFMSFSTQGQLTNKDAMALKLRR
ncbi:hypothetical protein Tco_0845618, partial [Tanacetum coccineum]